MENMRVKTASFRFFAKHALVSREAFGGGVKPSLALSSRSMAATFATSRVAFKSAHVRSAATNPSLNGSEALCKRNCTSQKTAKARRGRRRSSHVHTSCRSEFLKPANAGERVSDFHAFTFVEVARSFGFTLHSSLAIASPPLTTSEGCK